MPADVICPYCFEKFSAREIAFRCIKPSGCPPEEDKALSEYQRLPTSLVLPRVFKASASLGTPHMGVCSCGTKTTKTVCPHCHNGLPCLFNTTDNYTVALIGAKEAGKSHYVGVLIHELMNNLGHRFNASLNALDDQTIRRYKSDFQRYIFENKELIPATRSARAQIDVRYPLVYRLSMERKRLFFWKRTLAASMVFFDTAGEDLTSEDLMATETRYIANSQGLIFLLDPLQIPAVRERLGLSSLSAGEASTPKEIIFRAAELIRKIHNLKASQKIKIPVALAFSKIDEVRSLLGPDSVVNRGAMHDGYFDLADAEEVDETIRSHVNHWLGPDFHATVALNYQNFAYFGVSALGQPPRDGTLPKGIQSFRVEDPFLWLLYRMRFIQGRRVNR